MGRLWDKGESVDDLVLRFTVGEDHLLDLELVPHDLRATGAHVRMLVAAGHISAADGQAVEAALERILEEYRRGEIVIRLEDEDCHTVIENRLTALVGEAGGRVHLGRSRNDQVLAALRLWMREALGELVEAAEAVVRALAELAAREGARPLPGYTHMQRAMPSTVALWAGGFESEIGDDVEGLRAVHRRIDKNPLGSAAGYGVPVVAIDREATRAALGFARTQEPVTAVQLSRGKAEAHLLFEAALLLQDLGRLAADLCLFATSEFRFVDLPAAFTTGSSIMPQKRNPDLFELVRGRSAQAAAELQQVLGVTGKLTSGYHRDLQLLKEPLFRGVRRALETTRVMAHALPGLRFRPEAAAAAEDPALRATEMALRLVADEGMSFREAYRRVGRTFGRSAEA